MEPYDSGESNYGYKDATPWTALFLALAIYFMMMLCAAYLIVSSFSTVKCFWLDSKSCQPIAKPDKD